MTANRGAQVLLPLRESKLPAVPLLRIKVVTALSTKDRLREPWRRERVVAQLKPGHIGRGRRRALAEDALSCSIIGVGDENVHQHGVEVDQDTSVDVDDAPAIKIASGNQPERAKAV